MEPAWSLKSAYECDVTSVYILMKIILLVSLTSHLDCAVRESVSTQCRWCVVADALADGCVDSLAFETLVPKQILHNYVTLLTEHRRVIFCGPTGTGKTYLARRLAQHLVVL